MGRIRESEFKGDFEKELTNWMRSVSTMATPLESNEDDFREGVDAEEA